MGRKATVNLNLPTGMRARKRKKKGEVITWYYYGRWRQATQRNSPRQ